MFERSSSTIYLLLAVKLPQYIFHWRFECDSAIRSKTRCVSLLSSERIVDRPSLWLHVHLAHSTHACITQRHPSNCDTYMRPFLMRCFHVSGCGYLVLSRDEGQGCCRRAVIVNHAASHSMRDRRRYCRRCALPIRPPTSRRVFRDVFTSDCFGK